jgi:broad specificity phosphatase PhoE
MKIFFVRYGQTLANLEKKSYNTNDELNSITDRGIQQAIHTGKYLKTFDKFDLIISSPLLRCIQTAEIISKEINYKKDIIKNELISEPIEGKASGLHFTEKNELLKKNKKLIGIYVLLKIYDF